MVGLSKSTFCPDNCLHGCCIIERYCNSKNTTSRSYGNAIFNTLNLLGSFMFVCKSFFSKCDMVENCWEPERRKVHCTSCRLDSSKQNSLQEWIQHQRQWGKDLRWDHLMLRPQFENTWTTWICPCYFFQVGDLMLSLYSSKPPFCQGANRPSQLAELSHSEFYQELFSHSAYVKFFVTFATKVPYLTFYDKRRQFLM